MSIFVIDSESLTDPLWLNQLDQSHIQIEHEPSSEAAAYHHVFFIRQNKEQEFSTELQKRLKRGWYSFSFGEDSILIMYNDKIFTYSTNNTSPLSYQDAIEHGAQQGIQKEFLDFHRYLMVYSQIVDRLKK